MAAPTDYSPAQPTFGELVRAATISTCTDLDVRLRKWSDAFDQTSAREVTSEQLERSAEAMIEASYRPATVNRDLGAMVTPYRFAKAKRLAPKGFRSPTLGVTRYDEGVHRVTISRDELEALRNRSLGFSDPRFAVYVHRLLDTGARKGELLERHWSEFDLARREILAPTTKNGMPRVLFFGQRTAELIERRPPGAPMTPSPSGARRQGSQSAIAAPERSSPGTSDARTSTSTTSAMPPRRPCCVAASQSACRRRPQSSG